MATLYQKTNLLRGLISREIAYTGPFHVSVDVTRRCNLKCLGCRYHSTEVNRPSPTDHRVVDVSFDMLERLCQELRAMNTRTLFLMGEEEPFLHNRIYDIIAMAKRSGFHVTVITNGTLLNESRIKSIINSQLDTLQVSLWASSSREYERQYPGADINNFEKVVNGLKLVQSFKAGRKKNKPAVTLHHPINRNNFQKIDAMGDLALLTGCDTISFSPFLSTQGKLSSYSLSPDEEKSLFLTLAKIKNQMRSMHLNHNIGRTLLRYQVGMKKGMKYKLPCYIGWYHTRIKIDGTVLPCGQCNIPMGNLKINSFREIWNSLSFRTFRRQTMTCEGLASLDQQCDCEFCCYTEDNLHIYRLFKWISPLCMS